MNYRQVITPNVNIGASRSWCLKYVDDAVNAPQRTATAQIAHDTARAKGWVQNNTDFPRNVWFVLFWSITKGAYAGQGHVALAYVNNNGSMQIHDSEVHAGARGIYISLNEISNWFSASGFQYLGWSIGVDGAKLIEKDDNNGNDNNNKIEGEDEMKIVKVLGNDTLYLVKSTGVKPLNGQEWIGVKRVFGFKDTDVDVINQAEFDGVAAAVRYTL